MEILSFMEKKAGTTLFYQARTQVEKRIAEVRAERKRRHAIKGPEAKAKRKIAKNVRKQFQRKKQRRLV